MLSVGCVLLWVVDVVSTNVGVLNGIAGGLYIKGDGAGCVLGFPAIS